MRTGVSRAGATRSITRATRTTSSATAVASISLARFRASISPRTTPTRGTATCSSSRTRVCLTVARGVSRSRSRCRRCCSSAARQRTGIICAVRSSTMRRPSPPGGSATRGDLRLAAGSRGPAGLPRVAPHDHAVHARHGAGHRQRCQPVQLAARFEHVPLLRGLEGAARARLAVRAGRLRRCRAQRKPAPSTSRSSPRTATSPSSASRSRC